MEVASAILPCRPSLHSLQTSSPKTPFFASYNKTFQPSHLRCSSSSTRSVTQNQLQKSFVNQSRSQFLHLGRPATSRTVHANAGAGAGAPAGSVALQTVSSGCWNCESFDLLPALIRKNKKTMAGCSAAAPAGVPRHRYRHWQAVEEGVRGGRHQVPECSVRHVLRLLRLAGSRCRRACCCGWIGEVLRTGDAVHTEVASSLLRPVSGCSTSRRQGHPCCFCSQNWFHLG